MGTFWCFLGKITDKLSILYRLWAKTYRTLVKEFQQSWKIFFVQRINLRFFRGKRTCKLLPFPDFERETFRFSAKVSSSIIKTSFNICRGKFRGFSWEIYISFHHFCTLSEKFNQLFYGKFSVGFSNCYKSIGISLGGTDFSKKI